MTNNSIGCNVTECKHHAGTVNQCSLNHIEIVKHKTPATCSECTDCQSFMKK